MRFVPSLLRLACALAPSVAAAGAGPDPSRVVSSVSVQFEDRGGRYPGRAEAAQEGCTIGLSLDVVDPKRASPTLVRRGLQPPGPACGEASVAAGPKGAVVFTIVNESHRPFSKETLTIVYRGGAFLVSGFAFASSETGGSESLDHPKPSSTCTVDFLAGRAFRYGKAGKVGLPPRLSDWDDARDAGCP